MNNDEKILLEIKNLRKYFSDKRHERAGSSGGSGCILLY